MSVLSYLFCLVSSNAKGGLQPQARRYMGWILFSFFLHFISLPLALNHLARLAVAGMLYDI